MNTLDTEKEWISKNCSDLNLKGRIRVANDGINAVLGGTLHNLQEHANSVAHHYGTDSIDFKLTKSSGKKNDAQAIESKFTTLTVDIVKVSRYILESLSLLQICIICNGGLGVCKCNARVS